jgi:hypothetical protein
MAGDTRAAQQTLRTFLARAERIAATQAAQREDLATIGTTMQVLMRLDQKHQQIERKHLPVPELLEAAAIVRPVTLERERVYLGKVASALGLLTLTAPERERTVVRALQKSWHKHLRGERWIVMVAHADEPQQTRLTDVEIAELWFNAHVWHDDEDKQWALRHIGESECLICATVWVSDRVQVARAVQQLIVDLRDSGHISL